MAEIQEHLRSVRDDIRATCEAQGRAPDSVRVVAVGKRQPIAKLAAAHTAGQRNFGESRVQELAARVAALPDDVQWHMVGHLQRNKARDAVAHCSLIHSVDSTALLERLELLAEEAGKRQDVLLQVNVAGEAQKYGFGPDEAEAALATALALPHLRCLGLMTMAPLEADEAALRDVFGGLRELRDRLATRCDTTLPELSMGMSHDYRAAIAEGATIVRLGTCIFGPREEGP